MASKSDLELREDVENDKVSSYITQVYVAFRFSLTRELFGWTRSIAMKVNRMID